MCCVGFFSKPVGGKIDRASDWFIVFQSSLFEKYIDGRVSQVLHLHVMENIKKAPGA